MRVVQREQHAQLLTHVQVRLARRLLGLLAPARPLHLRRDDGGSEDGGRREEGGGRREEGGGRE